MSWDWDSGGWESMVWDLETCGVREGFVGDCVCSDCWSVSLGLKRRRGDWMFTFGLGLICLVICRDDRGVGEVSLISLGEGAGDFGGEGFRLLTTSENRREGCGGEL